MKSTNIFFNNCQKKQLKEFKVAKAQTLGEKGFVKEWGWRPLFRIVNLSVLFDFSAMCMCFFDKNRYIRETAVGR